MSFFTNLLKWKVPRFNAAGTALVLPGGGEAPFGGVAGVSPSNTASENTAALQAALDVGGVVTLEGAGTYLINDTLFLPSNTHLRLGKNTEIKQASGVHKNQFRNKNFGEQDGTTWIGISSITASGTTATVTTTAAHGLTTGEHVNVLGALQKYYNNVHKITVTGANTFTYSLDVYSGYTYTTPATFTSTSITGTSSAGSKVVTGVSTLTGVYAGMVVTGTNIPDNTFIDLIDSATQITLNQNATGANSGLTVSFPLRCHKADVNISITGGIINYNAAEQGPVDDHSLYSVVFRHVKGVSFRDIVFRDIGLGAITVEGGHDVLYENIEMYGSDTHQSNGIHPVDWSGSNVVVYNCRGQTKDDLISVIGKQYAQYSDAGSPIGDIVDMDIENINSYGTTAVVKLLPIPGREMDNISIRNLRGRSSSGTICNVVWDSVNTGAHAAGAIGTVKNLHLYNIATRENSVGTVLAMTCHVSNLVFERTKAILSGNGKLVSIPAGVTVDRMHIDQSRITGGSLPVQVVGTLSHMLLTDTKLESVGVFAKFESGAPAPRIQAVNVDMDACGTLLSFVAQQGITGSFTNIEFRNYTSNFIICASNPQAFFRFNGCNIAQGNLYSGTWNNAAFWWNDSYGYENYAAAASFTPDGLKYPRKRINLNQNATINNTTNILEYNNQDGLRVTFMIREDATGNHTVTWGTQYVFQVAFVQSGAGSANKTTLVEFEHDGKGKLHQIGSTNVWV